MGRHAKVEDLQMGVEPALEVVLTRDQIQAEGLHVVSYPAMLDVPIELVVYVSALLAATGLRSARGVGRGC